MIRLRLKQNKYPVLFLTQGVTSKYPEYNDPRTKDIPIAINYARFAGILGLNVHTEDILRDPSQVKEITNHGLVAFCWGEDNNDIGTIKYLKDLGMDGVIYDRIDDTIQAKTSVFFTEHQEELLQLAAKSPEAAIVDENSTPFQFDHNNIMTPNPGVGTSSNMVMMLEDNPMSMEEQMVNTINVGNVIAYSNAEEIDVKSAKNTDIDSTSMFPDIKTTLNLAVKECGVWQETTE